MFDQHESDAATLLAGEIESPNSSFIGRGTVDLSLIPAVPVAHDHVTVELADPLMRIVRADGSSFAIDAEDDPHASLWRHYQPPCAPDPRDVFALEPCSIGGARSPKPPAPPSRSISVSFSATERA